MATVQFNSREKTLIDTLLRINESKTLGDVLRTNDSHLSFRRILIICANAWKCEPSAFLGKINTRSQLDRSKKLSFLFGLYFFSNLDRSEAAKQIGWDCEMCWINCPVWFEKLVSTKNRYAGVHAKIISQMDKECPERLGLSAPDRTSLAEKRVPVVCITCDYRRNCPHNGTFSYRMKKCPLLETASRLGIIESLSSQGKYVDLSEDLYILIKGLESATDEATLN